MKKNIIFLFAVLSFSYQNMSNNIDKDLNLALHHKYKEALFNFEKRCKNNDGYACGMAGYFYDKGFGVAKNHNLAISFYTKGCSLNDADSCTLLGYDNFKHGKKDKAKELLKKGCSLGNKDACNYLQGIKLKSH